jgi:orotate phosphoribosyltransferase
MKTDIARILLEIAAVRLSPKEPFTFTSGLKSPIYIDNRLVISYPEERKEIVKYMSEKAKELDFDVVGGVATAGIHWAAWLSAMLDKPMVYIRDKAKSHGRQNQIEGLLKPGQKVLLIEDHVSTGKSSLDAVRVVREAGGIAEACIAITTYEFSEADALFAKERCRLITLTDFTSIIEQAVEMQYLSAKDKERVLEWSKSPKNWA